MMSFVLKLVALNLVIASTIASATCGDEVSIPAADPIRAHVQALHTTAKDHDNQATIFTSDVKAMSNTLDRHAAMMSFRERHLWKGLAVFLGANGDRIDNHAKLQETLAAKRASLAGAKERATSSEAEVIAAVEGWLASNDGHFQELKKQREELDRIVAAGQRCLNKIEKALENVDDAQSRDMWAAFTDSKILDYMAADETDGANKAIHRVKIAIRKYSEALTKMRAHLADPELGAGVEAFEPINTSFQFGFDIFTESGLVDFLNMSKLSDAEEELQRVKGKIEEIHAKIVAEHEALLARIQERVCQSRTECLR